MENRSVDAKGIRVRWQEQDSGQPVILVHGIPNAALLLLAASSASKHRRCVRKASA